MPPYPNNYENPGRRGVRHPPTIMRRTGLVVIALAIASCSHVGALTPLRPQLLRPRAPVHSVRLTEALPETSDVACWPVDLHGPWELRTTLPGSNGRTWVELVGDGSCSCATAVGTGKDWQATRKLGKWQLRFVLLDKLKRPIAYEGVVGDDDDARRLVVAGSVLGPPKRLSAQSSAPQQIGEFEGWHLD